MKTIADWIGEHKSAITTRVILLLGAAVTAAVTAVISGWFSDGSDGEQDSRPRPAVLSPGWTIGNSRYDDTTGDSSSRSASQGGDVLVTSPNAAQSGSLSAEIQNNANQNVTVVLISEGESEEMEPTGPSPNGNQSDSKSDSTGSDGASDEQGRSPSTGDLIREMGTEDVYEVQGPYRRLIIADGIINRVPQWHWEDIKDVTRAVMTRYAVSNLVRLPDDDGKVYWVEPVGADSAILRHVPNEAAFDRAGCRWAAIYDITEQENSFSGYSKGRAMPGSGWSCW